MSSDIKDNWGGRKNPPATLNSSKSDYPASEQLHSYTRPLQSAVASSTKSSRKSADSLDSGIYSRQKSCGSMDSLISNESGFNGNGPADDSIDLSSSDEMLPPLPINQYEDYLRELQDIRQSVIIKSGDDDQQPMTRTDSGEDQDDDLEGDWLRKAGLSDLVMTSSNMMMMSDGSELTSRISTDLSSMTVLSTLTRPQREAVLKRITSFNRAQKTKKRPKPAITSIFPTVDTSPATTPDDGSKLLGEAKLISEKSVKSPVKPGSLPLENRFGEEGYPRRYSETPRVKGSPVVPTTPGSLDSSLRMDYGARHRKNVVDSIVASSLSGANSSPASTESVSSSTPTDPHSPCDLYDDGLALPRKHGYLLISDIHASISMPELNTLEQDDLESTISIPSSNDNSVTASSENRNSLPSSPTRRLNTVATDRNVKALSDIPVSDLQSLDLPLASMPRLLLKAENERDAKKNKKPKKSRSLKLKAISSIRSILGDDNVFAGSHSPKTPKDKKSSMSPTPGRKQPIIKSRIEQQTAPKGITNSPELKNRFLLSPSLSIKALKRRSPGNSPLRARKLSAPTSPPVQPITKEVTKRSPLHRLSSLSFSSFRSPPVRTGSYKVNSAATTHRQSLRRARSLKVRKKRPVSLVSARLPSSTDSSQFNTNAPSIEMLSISTKSDSSTWRDDKGDIPTQFTTNDSGKMPKNLSYSEAASQENLPNFSLVRDRLGITKLSDLSKVDMRKVQSLALIELSALFDLRGIDLKRRKLGKNKHKETGAFGTTLTTLVEWDRKRTGNENCRVPLVLSEIIDFLERNALQDEGILRKSGSAARTKLLKQDIETRFGSSGSIDSNSQVWSDARSHDVAALLKQFLRELPDPLLTTEYIDAFQSCGLIPDRKEQLQALNLLIILLNEVHRDSLKLLLKFLSQVVVNEKANKMSLNNVAMITAPNLFISGRKSKKDNTTSQDLQHAAGTSNIVRILIKYHKLLWTIPAFMLTQVRHMNSAEISCKKHHNTSKEKTKKKKNKKDLNKKQSSQEDSQPFDYETPKGLIRVQAPNMHLTSMAVQLDDQLTAGDVIGKYQRQCERMHLGGTNMYSEVTNFSHALYEVGGNIHERCLDVDTNMNALIKVNPEATWFIRQRSTS